jgi:hypothetical protein
MFYFVRYKFAGASVVMQRAYRQEYNRGKTAPTREEPEFQKWHTEELYRMTIQELINILEQFDPDVAAT